VFAAVPSAVIVAHCFACVFFSLGWRLRCQGPGYEQTWLDELENPELELPECTTLGPLGTFNITADQHLTGATAGRPHWLDMWVLSLHWAISSMSSLGYGRGPTAVTIVEFGFAVFCQVFGACVYAAIFGNIAQLLMKVDAPGARYRQQRDKIDEFVAFHELPSELTSKLHAYCKFLFAVNHGFDVGQISGALPPNLQHQLLLHLHAPLVKSVPMFEECDDAFIKAIVLQLRPQVLLGGDAAFKQDEAGTEMYFIMRGEMRMMDDTLTVCYNALYSGAYFGELAMLTGQPRTATALAVTDCVLFYINQSDFNLVARKWPKALAKILAKAKERLERINSTNTHALAAQLGHRLSDIHCIIAEERQGLLGVSDAAASSMPNARNLPKPTEDNSRQTSKTQARDTTRPVEPEDSDEGGLSVATMIADERFKQWQRGMELSISQANEGVQMILERLALVSSDNGTGGSNRLADGGGRTGHLGGARKRSLLAARPPAMGDSSNAPSPLGAQMQGSESMSA
jgi:CRP-like cAMP-binding protein